MTLHWMSSRAAVLVALVFALSANVAVIVTAAVTRHSVSIYQQCEAQYQQDFASGYRARYRISVSVARAMDAVVQAVSDKDPKEFEAAVSHYISLRHQQNVTRVAHPLPQLPAQVCGPARDASQ